MTSSFFTTIPIADALWNAPKEIGLQIDWRANPGNPMQEMVCGNKHGSLKLAGSLSSEQLMSKASMYVSVVNEFLADGGFPDVKLMDQGTRDMFYAASIIKLIGKFLVEGERDYWLKRMSKPGFRFGKDAGVVHRVFNGHRVIEIPTQSRFSLLITAPTGVSDFRMVVDWVNIISNMTRIDGNGVVLPMVKIGNTKIDVTAIKGMSGSGWVIAQAVMAAKFSLTPSEVSFEAAFAYSAKRGVSSVLNPQVGDYVADHPLYFALAKKGHLLPLAVGLIDQGDFSNITLF